jgi:anthranilate phosphoribosyltransferase
MKPLLSLLAEGHVLSQQEAEKAFGALLEGQVSPVQAAAFLMALRVRGESVAEIEAGAASLRARMLRITAPPDAIDIVGTGGDHSGSYNISTLAALITAACGVPVAKHGNRAASSRSGAADVLTALGVTLTGAVATLEACLDQAKLCFLFAQNHHPAMRHVAPVRAELGLRTVFNLLGPLANPAGVTRQLLGAYSDAWLMPLAHVLKALGTQRAWLVHGQDGMDEITLTAPTSVVALENGVFRAFTLDPREHGLALVSPESLKGGSPEENAAALKAVLEGTKNAYRDIACLNAAAALVVADRAKDVDEGLILARQALDDGRVLATLYKLVALSKG